MEEGICGLQYILRTESLFYYYLSFRIDRQSYPLESAIAAELQMLSVLFRVTVAAFRWTKSNISCNDGLQDDRWGVLFQFIPGEAQRNWAHIELLTLGLWVVRKIDSWARSPLGEDRSAPWLELVHHMTLRAWKWNKTSAVKMENYVNDTRVDNISYLLRAFSVLVIHNYCLS